MNSRMALCTGSLALLMLLPMLPWSLPVAAELGVDGPHDAAQPWLPALRTWLQPVQQACQRPQALHQLLKGEV